MFQAVMDLTTKVMKTQAAAPTSAPTDSTAGDGAAESADVPVQQETAVDLPEGESRRQCSNKLLYQICTLNLATLKYSLIVLEIS